MKGYIYKYTFPDGKIYIGQTRRPIELRHAEHFNPCTGPLNPGFWKAYQTVGSPELTVLETIEADDITTLVELLNRKETAYIYREKATDPEFGYNKKTTANTFSPETKILNKVFRDMCKEVEKEMQPFFDGLTEKLFNGREDELSEEEKAFVEEYINHNNIFVHQSEEEVEMVENDIVEEDVNLDEDDYSIFDEAIEYAVWRYNEGVREIIGQYIRENAAEIIRREKQGKIIQQLDKEGNVIREYESQDEIRKAFNIVRLDNIISAIKGRLKTAYGFRWRYKPIEDYYSPE